MTDDIDVTEVTASYHNTFEDKERGQWPKFGASMSASLREGQDPSEIINALEAACKAHVDKRRVAYEYEHEVETDVVERLTSMTAAEFLALAEAGGSGGADGETDLALDLDFDGEGGSA
jgi:uncharacterized protein (DUF1697 family)